MREHMLFKLKYGHLNLPDNLVDVAAPFSQYKITTEQQYNVRITTRHNRFSVYSIAHHKRFDVFIYDTVNNTYPFTLSSYSLTEVINLINNTILSSEMMYPK